MSTSMQDANLEIGPDEFEDAELPEPKPFLKWVGGKRQLAPELIKIIHELRGRPIKREPTYYEPFVGGGALFFAMRARPWDGPALLNDSNALLVKAYLGVRDDVEAVITELQSGYAYNEAEYYRERERYSLMLEKENDEAAAWLIYMNRTGFNGLFRVSKKGRYNVPFGKYTNPTICDPDGLRAASKALRGATIVNRDFEKAVAPAERGDLVYFDSPYVPVSSTADFTSYTTDGFTAKDQLRLRDCAVRLKKRGVHVILSNADLPVVHEMYTGFNIRRVEARRAINSKGTGRGPVGEVIIT